MTKFNVPTLVAPASRRVPDTRNLAGGEAWEQSPEAAFVAQVTTSMVSDQFYRSAQDGLADLWALMAQVDPYFAAQTAVYARTQDNLRSISHVIAGEIAANVKGEQWTKDFYKAVVVRPDDATEILAYYLQRFGKPIPNSLKKGLGSALGKFDEYQLAKYRGENHGLSLVDAVNLIHARPTGKNRVALEKLVNGKLRSTGTFESVKSAAGADGESAWSELVSTGKIGYMALLKNLRNIDQQAPELVDAACELLTDRDRVVNSRVLPFRFLTAYEQVTNPKMLAAISDAIDLSLENIPNIGEKSYIAVDSSGSMDWGYVSNSQMTYKRVASLFAAALFKASGADVVCFDNNCYDISGLNPRDSTLTISQKIESQSRGGGTNLQSIFPHAKKKYDTVVIFSDMQAWIGTYYGSSPVGTFADYKKRTGANPKVFCFDLAGYGTTQFEKDIYQFSGFSDKSLAMIARFKEDPNVLVKTIKEITF